MMEFLEDDELELMADGDSAEQDKWTKGKSPYVLISILPSINRIRVVIVSRRLPMLVLSM